MGRGDDEKTKVYVVDFGLAKEHIDPATKRPFSPRRNTDFRGTIPYASLNAHNKQELSRRDDLWSFYFMLLEFLDEPLTWKQSEFPLLLNFHRHQQGRSERHQVKGFQEPWKVALSQTREEV